MEILLCGDLAGEKKAVKADGYPQMRASAETGDLKRNDRRCGKCPE
ncbi:hypothetical protein [Fumia xinanensis]|uniref:Uncharacterized protein n=1 Tax=Fumia xinanensis TaxID=2763659 RepID=A0A926I765_9FIRM|nr:hypothetical protein [Fumia xinanensis]MBC8559694.1 hypothetical protein [Fumia xinanensis]